MTAKIAKGELSLPLYLIRLAVKGKFTIAALGISALIFFVAWSQMTSNVFPPGDDPGNWLKRVNAVGGRIYPLWDESVFTYPPLFFVVSYAFSVFVADRLTALKLTAVLVFSAIPFLAFLLSRRVTGSNLAGLATSWLVAFFPGQFEMIWWGAYPNLLALAIMTVAILMFLSAQEGSPRHLILAVACGVLVLVTHHLTSLVYLGTLALVALVSFFTGETKAAKTSLAMLAASVPFFAVIWGVNLAPYVTQNPLILEAGTLSFGSLVFLFKDDALAILSLLSVALGFVQLFFLKRIKQAAPVLAWLIAALLLTQLHLLGFMIDYSRFLFMIAVPLATSASVSVMNLTRCLKVSKTAEGEDGVYEVEIQVERAAPVALLLVILLLTPVQGVYANQSAYAHYVWQTKYSSEARVQALSWIRQNTRETATIVSDFSLGRWVESYGERRGLFPVPPEAVFIRSEFNRCLAADTIMCSNYQLANKYVRLDEWQPLSSRFSPQVSVFQGNRYVGLVYLSDSFVKVNLTRDGKTWIEAPHSAWFYQTRWLERTSQAARVQVSFGTMGLSAEKELSLQAGRPYAEVSYRFVPKQDVSLNTVSVNVYLVWGRTLIRYEKGASEITLLTEIGGVKVKFAGDLLGIDVGRDPEFNQTRIAAVFKAKPDKAELGVVFEAVSPQASWVDGVWAASSAETERYYGVTHVAIPPTSDYADRFSFRLPQGPVVYIDDCYARVEFVKDGSVWIEAPFRGTVLHDGPDSTTYETLALYVNKTTVQRGSSVEVSYEVGGKEKVLPREMRLSVWLSWTRMVSDVEVRDGKLLLVTDAGALEVEPNGRVLDLSYGFDEEFHMPRILVVYGLDPKQNRTSLVFRAANDYSSLSLKVQKTTRPSMEGSDKTTISVLGVSYKEVFRNNEIVIYETPRDTRK